MTTAGLFVVDAFTAVPFGGNPAAVCLLERPASESWMQSVAAEMNLSETAFVVPNKGGSGFELRWFTPAVEVDLCGHATLASAHVLWENGRLMPGQPAVFETKMAGVLTCLRDGGWIRMDFPARSIRPLVGTEGEGLLEVLGAGSGGVVVGRVNQDYLVVLPQAEEVAALQPDHGRLARFPLRAVMVTAAGGGEGVDFVSRFFAPGVGITEDPVTGSAHSALAPFWASRLGRQNLVARQVSRRGGELRLGVRGDRVDIAGQAVTVSRGEWAGAVS